VSGFCSWRENAIATLHETQPVWLPHYALAEAGSMRFFSLLALGIGLARELSGEAQMDRLEAPGAACHCGEAKLDRVIRSAQANPPGLAASARSATVRRVSTNDRKAFRRRDEVLLSYGTNRSVWRNPLTLFTWAMCSWRKLPWRS